MAQAGAEGGDWKTKLNLPPKDTRIRTEASMPGASPWSTREAGSLFVLFLVVYQSAFMSCADLLAPFLTSVWLHDGITIVAQQRCSEAPPYAMHL